MNIGVGKPNSAESKSGLTIAAVGGAGIWAWRPGVPGPLDDLMADALSDANGSAGLALADVTLTGRDNAPLGEIIAALAAGRGEPNLKVNPDAARARLESLGWVEKASVGLARLGRILVHIIERKPFALWRHNGALFLIDRAGVIITGRDLGRFAKLPMVVGGDAPGHAGDLMDMLARQPALFARVRAAVRAGGRRWDVHLDNDVTVRLPESGAVAAWARVARINDVRGVIDRARHGPGENFQTEKDHKNCAGNDRRPAGGNHRTNETEIDSVTGVEAFK